MGWFQDWLNDVAEHIMHTNDVNAGIGIEGMYNLTQAAQGNGTPLESTKQEVTDDKNVRNGSEPFSELIKKYDNGEMSALDIQAYVASHGMSLRPYEEAWLNNVLGIQATQSDRDYQTSMRDSSLVSTYEQLLKLGLNPGSTVNVGGSSSGVSSQAARLTPSEVSKMEFDRRTQMAKTLIGLAGGLASTGAHGAALGAAKFAASKLTSEASRYATDSKYH